MSSIIRQYDIKNEIEPGKALVIVGPRRVGKTTLVRNFLEETDEGHLFFTGDDSGVQRQFSQTELTHLQSLIGDTKLLVIDEAQNIPNIGQSLKLLLDADPLLKVIATGSSSFELAGQLGEPLTGRKKTKVLYPVAQLELRHSHQPLELKLQLESYLLYGSYPHVITASSKASKEELLQELIDSYLFRDILTFKEVKGALFLRRLLSFLAYQIGSEVSLTEIATTLQVDRKTVERYLDLFEQSYIIHRVGGYSRNMRSEITAKAKYYFYDLGIRNALIANFNSIQDRNDVGMLWENFIVLERLKFRTYTNLRANQYFWRTWAGQEVDIVEERSGKLYGFECKWGTKLVKAPRTWLETYPDEASWEVITPENYLDFII
jgi:hypothetical protein